MSQPHQVAAAARSAAITRVLLRVLVLNLVVAAAKIAFGLWSGTISILSDGFHSLTDSVSNAVGYLGTRVSQQPADESHPYGHRKFETLSAAGIFVFLALVVVQLIQTAWARLSAPQTPEVTPLSFAVMGGTLAINVMVVIYESRAGRRLKSEVLVADSLHTRSDIYTSLAVIAALVGMSFGYPILDPIAALVVAVFIGYAGFKIARDTSAVLADHVVLDADEIRRVVATVPEVLGCHHIRTRGASDYAFLDLHVWFPPTMALDEAHRLSHLVKDRLLVAFPALADVIIHIEPPPRH